MYFIYFIHFIFQLLGDFRLFSQKSAKSKSKNYTIARFHLHIMNLTACFPNKFMLKQVKECVSQNDKQFFEAGDGKCSGAGGFGHGDHILVAKYVGKNPGSLCPSNLSEQICGTCRIHIFCWTICKNTNIKSVVFEDGVSFQNNNTSFAFYSCFYLVNAPTIPNGVTRIDRAFENCVSLVNAPDIPYKVRYMQPAFLGCYDLVNVPIISDNIISMEKSFEGCSSLTGDIEINTNPSNFVDCFNKAADNDDCHVYLTGSSSMLTELAATDTAGNVTVR